MKKNLKKISVKSSVKKLLLAFVLTLMAAFPAFAETEQYVPGEALVVIRDQAATRSVRPARDRAAAFARSVEARAVRTYDALSEADGNVYALIRSETQSTEELVESLKTNPGVIAASPNWIVRANATPNDTYYTNGGLWGMTAIGAEAAWDIATGSDDIYVAVLDSGIQSDHEDFGGNIATGLARNFMTNDPAKSRDVTDGDGHGTHVSGTIGAVGNNGKGVAGVNWRVKIIPVKVLDDAGIGNTGTLIDGINYIVDLLQKDDTMKIAAVNFSMNGYRNTNPADIRNSPDWIAFKALDSLNRAVLVFAAGNEGVEADAPLTQDARGNGGGIVGRVGQYNFPTYYTGIDNMIVVGAINQAKDAASFTNWSGRSVHLVAPGLNIRSTYKGNAYREESGTSMAAPHVSGAAALLLAQNKSWTAPQIKARLLATAVQPTNPQSPSSVAAQYVPDKTVSAYGLLRIDRALSRDVDPPAVRTTSIRLFAPSGKLRVDERAAIAATVLPYHATNKGITWSSSDNAVLTVDAYGVVHAVAKGRATVTATASDGSGAPGSLTIEVTSSSNDTPSEGGGGGGGCSAFAGVLPLAVSALFLAARRRTGQ